MISHAVWLYYRSSPQGQRFLAVQAVARNLFAVGRHRLRASHQRQLRSRALEACQQAAADIVVAFLSSPLTGAASDVAATAASYPEVVGGAVQHAQMRE